MDLKVLLTKSATKRELTNTPLLFYFFPLLAVGHLATVVHLLLLSAL